MNDIDYTRQKLEEYGKEVAHLLEKQEYSNFLNNYLFKLTTYLIRYQTLTQSEIENIKSNVKKENTSADKKNETQ